jgi:chromosome partitioning protein
MAETPGLVIAVANLKGGTGKTTSAAFIAHALAEAGLQVLGVDADPQGSLLRWSESGIWRIPVVGMAVRTLHTQLPGFLGSHQAVVIDTPPLEEARGIVMSALRAATHVVVPIAPTPIEVERLSAVRGALEDVSDVREDGRPPIGAVLLTRTVAGASSTHVWRQVVSEQGWHVLGPEVRRLEAIAQAYGDPIDRASSTTAYGPAVEELLGLEVSA